jgi:hypothetical protein
MKTAKKGDHAIQHLNVGTQYELAARVTRLGEFLQIKFTLCMVLKIKKLAIFWENFFQS